MKGYWENPFQLSKNVKIGEDVGLDLKLSYAVRACPLETIANAH